MQHYIRQERETKVTSITRLRDRHVLFLSILSLNLSNYSKKKLYGVTLVSGNLKFNMELNDQCRIVIYQCVKIEILLVFTILALGYTYVYNITLLLVLVSHTNRFIFALSIN